VFSSDFARADSADSGTTTVSFSSRTIGWRDIFRHHCSPVVPQVIFLVLPVLCFLRVFSPFLSSRSIIYCVFFFLFVIVCVGLDVPPSSVPLLRCLTDLVTFLAFPTYFPTRRWSSSPFRLITHFYKLRFLLPVALGSLHLSLGPYPLPFSRRRVASFAFSCPVACIYKSSFFFFWLLFTAAPRAVSYGKARAYFFYLRSQSSSLTDFSLPRLPSACLSCRTPYLFVILYALYSVAPLVWPPRDRCELFFLRWQDHIPSLSCYAIFFTCAAIPAASLVAFPSFPSPYFR